jgi:hypothetical protein
MTERTHITHPITLNRDSEGILVTSPLDWSDGTYVHYRLHLPIEAGSSTIRDLEVKALRAAIDRLTRVADALEKG